MGRGVGVTRQSRKRPRTPCATQQAKDDVVPVPVYLDEAGDVAAQLAAAAEAAATAGSPIRALLITNPNNPLGIVYSTATLSAMLVWCVQQDVHFVRYLDGQGCLIEITVWQARA